MSWAERIPPHIIIRNADNTDWIHARAVVAKLEAVVEAAKKVLVSLEGFGYEDYPDVMRLTEALEALEE